MSKKTRPGQVLCGDHASLPSRQAAAPAPGCRVLGFLLSQLASVVVYIVCVCLFSLLPLSVVAAVDVGQSGCSEQGESAGTAAVRWDSSGLGWRLCGTSAGYACMLARAYMRVVHSLFGVPLVHSVILCAG